MWNIHKPPQCPSAIALLCRGRGLKTFGLSFSKHFHFLECKKMHVWTMISQTPLLPNHSLECKSVLQKCQRIQDNAYQKCTFRTMFFLGEQCQTPFSPVKLSVLRSPRLQEIAYQSTDFLRISWGVTPNPPSKTICRSFLIVERIGENSGHLWQKVWKFVYRGNLGCRIRKDQPPNWELIGLATRGRFLIKKKTIDNILSTKTFL